MIQFSMIQEAISSGMDYARLSTWKDAHDHLSEDKRKESAEKNSQLIQFLFYATVKKEVDADTEWYDLRVYDQVRSGQADNSGQNCSTVPN